jgi:hypothetical protein
VVTHIGNSFAGRVAGSLLSAVGLPELITRTRAGYEALATELALDKQTLSDICGRLQESHLAPSLFDAALYTRRLETAYEAIYQRLAAKSYRRSSARMRTAVAAVGKLGRQFPKRWTAPSPLVDSTIRSLRPTAEGLRGCCRPLAGTFDGKWNPSKNYNEFNVL